MTGAVRPSLLLASAAVGLILLMACANLAHMFLARMIERHQELRVREALGARPRHLISEILAEGLLVAGMGAALGAAMAVSMGRVIQSYTAEQIPQFEWTGIAAPVLLFAGGTCAGCRGVVHAPHVSTHAAPSPTLVSAGGRTIARGRSRISAC